MAIRMTPSELRDLASNVTSIRDEILNQVNNMDNKIKTVTEAWDGESKTAYFSEYEEILPALQNTFPQVIEDLATRLTFAADKLEQADQDIATVLKGN
jgi:WXG100 family type VII secretion target